MRVSVGGDTGRCGSCKNEMHKSDLYQMDFNLVLFFFIYENKKTTHETEVKSR